MSRLAPASAPWQRCALGLIVAVTSLGLGGCVTEPSPPPRLPEAANEPGFSLTPGATIEVGGNKAAEVPFETYGVTRAGADVITIEKVLAVLPRWKPGDTITVRGRYVLTSQSSAVLGLYVAGGGDTGPTSLRQRKLVMKGSGTFELTCEIPPRGGEPHVSFYPSGNGDSFGGVYFKPAGN